MDLNTITQVKRPASAMEIDQWPAGHAWLAGGTWLFSEPQRSLDTLVDLAALAWTPLQATAEGLEIAATCRIADLYAFDAPAEWIAAPLLRECCNCLLASFKIWNAATIGGNICMSLPAGAMISLTAALEGTLELLPRRGEPRQIRVLDFVTGNHRNVLAPGELLRAINLPSSTLRKRFAIRHMSLTKLGRSAALIVGTQALGSDEMLLTLSASTPRPLQIFFDRMPTASALRHAIDEAVATDGWFHDVHGSAAYKQHLTYRSAEQICQELSGPRTAP